MPLDSSITLASDKAPVGGEVARSAAGGAAEEEAPQSAASETDSGPPRKRRESTAHAWSRRISRVVFGAPRSTASSTSSGGDDDDDDGTRNERVGIGVARRGAPGPPPGGGALVHEGFGDRDDSDDDPLAAQRFRGRGAANATGGDAPVPARKPRSTMVRLFASLGGGDEDDDVDRRASSMWASSPSDRPNRTGQRKSSFFDPLTSTFNEFYNWAPPETHGRKKKDKRGGGKKSGPKRPKHFWKKSEVYMSEATKDAAEADVTDAANTDDNHTALHLKKVRHQREKVRMCFCMYRLVTPRGDPS